MNLYHLIKTDILESMRYFLLLTLALINFSALAYAEDGSLLAKMTDPDSTVIERPEEEKYVYGTVQNFSKLYWKLGALSTNDSKAVDNFLLINECDIYKSFYDDDFQWSEVRRSAAQMIDQEKEGFPDHFRFTIPIDLGRYDTVKRGFPIVSGTDIKNLRRIQIGGNSSSTKICDKEGKIELYPKNIIMILNRPLTFDFMELDEHIAQAFIVKRKYEKPEFSNHRTAAKYKRPVFMQLRVSILHFQGIQSDTNTFEQLATVYGKVDAIDVYEDKERTNLLKTIKFTAKTRAVKDESKPAESSEEIMDSPSDSSN